MRYEGLLRCSVLGRVVGSEPFLGLVEELDRQNSG
jgi:hypothetical protein